MHPADEPERNRQQPEARRIWEREKEQTTEKAIAERPRMMMLDRGARFLDERCIANARWTCSLAGHTAKARIKVRDDAIAHWDSLLEPGAHQVDPAARRIHFLAEDHVARTRRQAESAVDALVHQRFERAER